MLGSLRKASQSWIAKAFFGLLVATFIGWGIGPELRMRLENQPAVRVGSEKIPAEVVANEFKRDAQRMQQMMGGKVSIDQLRQSGFLDQTVQRLVSQALLDQESEKLGLAVDDDAVRRAIAQIPAFRSQLNGQFDPTTYRQALASNGLTEARFEGMERDDIRRSRLYDMIGDGVVAPTALLDAIFARAFEQRAADMIDFDAAAMPAPAAPEQSVLEAYHKEHAADFTAPEYRAVTALVLRTQDTVADYAPTDDQIAKAYQDRQAEYATEETRHLQQVFFPDKESAQKLVDSVNGGASFADAAKAAGKEVDDLGTIDRKALPIAALVEAAFATAKPGIAGPVQTPLGFNVVNVVAIQPGSVKPLAEVREQIVADLKNTEAIARVNALSNKLEDGIGSGASLEEIAGNLKLAALKIAAIDAKGAGADGKPVPGLPDSAALRAAIAATAKGSSSDVITLENEAGFAVVRVDDVTPPALKPFDAVKDAVLAAWTKTAQIAEAKTAAEDAAKSLGQGGPADKVAGKATLTISKPFTRTGTDEVPSPIAAEAFKLKIGEASTVPIGDHVFAVRLAAIIPADPKAQAAALDELKANIVKSITADLNLAYLQALQKEIGVRIRPDLIEAQFSQSQ